VLQLPAIVFSSEPAPAESSPQLAGQEETPKLAPTRKQKPARPVTPIGAIQFAVYVLLIAGLWNVLHLLRGDVAFMPNARVLRYALDAGSALLWVPWIFAVRGRLASLGLKRWVPSFCSIMLIACAVPAALGVLSFQHALVLFVVLQIPTIILRQEFIPARLIQPGSSEELGANS
jgi:hypothetical protein